MAKNRRCIIVKTVMVALLVIITGFFSLGSNPYAASFDQSDFTDTIDAGSVVYITNDGIADGLSVMAVQGTGIFSLGNLYGVRGQAIDSAGYGIFSEGHARVEGDIHLTGKIVQYKKIQNKYNNRQNTCTYVNLARKLRDEDIEIVQWQDERGAQEIITNSTHDDFNNGQSYNNYNKRNIVDGIYQQWDKGEYASNGVRPIINDAKTHLGIRLKLGKRYPCVNICEIIIYPRPNIVDLFEDSWLFLTHLDGSQSSYHIGPSTIGGTEKRIPMNNGVEEDVVQVDLRITHAPKALNVGVAEIELWGINPFEVH
jgi:hypothetical protein